MSRYPGDNPSRYRGNEAVELSQSK